MNVTKFYRLREIIGDRKQGIHGEYSGETVPLILEESVPPNSGWI